MTQEELALSANCSQAAISQLETNSRGMTLETARSLAAALGVPVVALLDARDWALPERRPILVPPADEEGSRYGSRLREVRKARGMSQQALGDLVGCSKMKISDVERDQMGLTLHFMRQCAKALGVHLTDLLLPGDRPTPSHVESQVLAAFNALAPDDQKSALAVLQALKR